MTPREPMVASNYKEFVVAVLLFFCLSACQSTSSTPSPEPEEETTPLPSLNPSANPSPTPPDSIGLYWGLSGQPIPDGLEAQLASIAGENGLEFLRVDPELAPPESTRYLVVFSGNGQDSMLLETGEIPTMLFGTTTIESQNVVYISPGLQDYRRLGFLSGYLAAAAAEEWRVGLLIAQNENPAFQEGFLNGVDYLCGLCQQAFPPFYSYPLVEVVPGNGQDISDDVFQRLAAGEINSLYLGPQLATQNISLIGELGEATLLGAVPYGQQPGASLAGYSGFDVLPVNFEQVINLWLSGENIGETEMEWSLLVRSADPEKLSEGKLTFVRQLLPFLLSGAIEP